MRQPRLKIAISALVLTGLAFTALWPSKQPGPAPLFSGINSSSSFNTSLWNSNLCPTNAGIGRSEKTLPAPGVYLSFPYAVIICVPKSVDPAMLKPIGGKLPMDDSQVNPPLELVPRK
jgi:hypothetical protein